MKAPKSEQLAKKHHAAIDELMAALAAEFISLTIQTCAGPVTFEPAAVRAHRRRPLKEITPESSPEDKAEAAQVEAIERQDAAEFEKSRVHNLLLELTRLKKELEVAGDRRDADECTRIEAAIAATNKRLRETTTQ